MERKNQRSKGLMALGGLAVLAAAALFCTDSLYQGLSVKEQSETEWELETVVEKEEEQKEEEEQEQEFSADVVVIGAGGAGLAAAVSASQEGASVIVIEKMPEIGGNLAMADRENAAGREDMAGEENAVGEEIVAGEENITDGENQGESEESVEPAGTGFIDTCIQYVEEHPEIEILVNTRAVEIRIGEPGIAGTVAAKGEEEKPIILHAKKGIVVATGGFAANAGLCQEYNEKWPELGETIKSTNRKGATGDAIPMLKALGAEFVQMENIQILPFGDPETGSLSGNVWQDAEHCVFVNKNGDRFIDESRYQDDITKALLEQPDHLMWIVMDSDCFPTEEEKNSFGEALNDLVSQNRVRKAENLEGLAAEMGVSAENLIVAVEDFNAHAEEGIVDDFGRTLYSDQIDDGPFYAVMRAPTIHSTLGGVKVNAKAQVISTDGKAIPGLYAAGEVTGEIREENSPDGSDLTDLIMLGRIAGREAALNGEADGSKEPKEGLSEPGRGQ